ncbi:glycoside hydrolase family 43 protein [Zopfia rhizophila CBS 207.26]|uniref:Glycoside hydrolase family 43 protein n=1 Tax=Zopfia rhizophila CBS 207.26 TaxID=1314779 RepID=A0A6A6DE77_9PEZI|nr:glycoside hydrolase family 43 protein [Zopfia rhizophila CBS 207.26]
MRSLNSILCWVLGVYAAFVGAATYSNPLKSTSGSDPHIVYTGGYYYLMTTTWTDLQITRATTLNGLKTGETKVVWTDSTSTRCCNVWAPELHYLGGIWYIYYSAGHSGDVAAQHPHVLKGGTSPWDSYTYLAQLTTDWGIDGTILRFTSWGNFFVYSCFSGSLQSLCIAPLTSPGSIGASKVLSTPTNSWETAGSPVNEGPAAMYHGGKTFLSYSASYCGTASYALGLLTWNGSGDPSLSSSWTKTGPFLTSANRNYGPGHNGFFQSPDGTQIWNVYHATANSGGTCGRARYTMAQIVNWNSDGSPNFGTLAALGTVLQGPSGE